MPGKILHGDNLDVLKEQVDNSIDLIYLDPPFNSGRSYNVTIVDSMAHEWMYVDTWTWDDAARAAYAEFTANASHGTAKSAAEVLSWLNKILLPKGGNFFAYFVMMAPRLVEMYRVLKGTGSLYLHCDPTASHYLKILLDALFGINNFRSEIVWKRTYSHRSSRGIGPVHDVILYYTKSDAFTWNGGHHAYKDGYEDTFRFTDPDGRKWMPVLLTGSGPRNGDSGKPWKGVDPTKGARPRHWAIPSCLADEFKQRTGLDLQGTTQERLDKLDTEGLIVWSDGRTPQYKQFLDARKGIPLNDVWDDINRLSATSSEKVNFEGQKPVALLERIILASSNKGDVVLDPFLGSGTTAVAAQRNEREWVGIELTPKASSIAQHRINTEFGDCYDLAHDWPSDVEAAKVLADKDWHRFQVWVAKQLGGLSTGRGPDRGIDGNVTLNGFSDGQSRNAIIQAKSKKTGVEAVRAFCKTFQRSGAIMGFFVAFKEHVTGGMREIAASEGTYRSGYEEDGMEYPRIQIINVEDFFNRALTNGGARYPSHVKRPDYSQTKEAVLRRQMGTFNLLDELPQEF